jgi:diguanylate cyclase (GGDEF)-like protein
MNDRFHSILGHEASGTMEAEFSLVDGEDKRTLASAVDRVLDGYGVDDVELRFVRFFDEPTEHVCVLSMRPLTDAASIVTGAVGCLSDVTEQVHLRRQLEQRANTDDLTSCLNRAAILDVLSQSVDQRDGGHLGIGVIFVDLCRFKAVNDAFGHTVGDYVLELAADRLRAAVREGDQVGRFGGDEFLIVCPGVDSDRSALEIAERIRHALTDQLNLGTGWIELRASIGIAWCVEPVSADELVAQADQAMYRAKRSGSAAVGVFAHSA